MKIHKFSKNAIKGWKIGDKFVIKDTLTLKNDQDDDVTGVVQPMLDMKGKVLTVVYTMTSLGVPMLIDNKENYCWRLEWVKKVEDVHVASVS